MRSYTGSEPNRTLVPRTRISDVIHPTREECGLDECIGLFSIVEHFYLLEPKRIEEVNLVRRLS